MAKVYEQIADDLRRLIREELEPGDRLPVEEELKNRYGKSKPTIRQAVTLLETEGLVEKRHGRGTFVREPRKVVSRSNERHQWEKDRVHAPEAERLETGCTERDTGLTVDDLVFQATYEKITADRDLAAVFGMREGTGLLKRTYRTRPRGQSTPFSLVTSYLVRNMIAENPDLLDERNEPWPGGTQHQLWTAGIEVGRIVERVRARPPSSEEADELELPPGTAVLDLRKVSYDTENRVVEVADVVLPGDSTEAVFVTPLKNTDPT